MTNKTELAYMNSEKGQAAYARMLCDAVKEYVGHINRMAGVDTVIVESKAEEPTKEQPAVVEELKSAPKTAESTPAKATTKETAKESAGKSVEGYAIQLLASDKRVNGNDQQFKSYRGKVECYEGGGVLKYKYCYGEYKSREEAQRNLSTIRRTFKDAFVVHFKDGRIVK
jgi:N-acetylmuramoyl-L-alanine amidase